MSPMDGVFQSDSRATREWSAGRPDDRLVTMKTSDFHQLAIDGSLTILRVPSAIDRAPAVFTGWRILSAAFKDDDGVFRTMALTEVEFRQQIYSKFTEVMLLVDTNVSQNFKYGYYADRHVPGPHAYSLMEPVDGSSMISEKREVIIRNPWGSADDRHKPWGEKFIISFDDFINNFDIIDFLKLENWNRYVHDGEFDGKASTNTVIKVETPGGSDNLRCMFGVFQDTMRTQDRMKDNDNWREDDLGFTVFEQVGDSMETIYHVSAFREKEVFMNREVDSGEIFLKPSTTYWFVPVSYRGMNAALARELKTTDFNNEFTTVLYSVSDALIVNKECLEQTDPVAKGLPSQAAFEQFFSEIGQTMFRKHWKEVLKDIPPVVITELTGFEGVSIIRRWVDQTLFMGIVNLSSQAVEVDLEPYFDFENHFYYTEGQIRVVPTGSFKLLATMSPRIDIEEHWKYTDQSLKAAIQITTGQWFALAPASYTEVTDRSSFAPVFKSEHELGEKLQMLRDKADRYAEEMKTFKTSLLAKAKFQQERSKNLKSFEQLAESARDS